MMVRVLILTALLVLASGCGRYYADRYYTEVSHNQRSLPKLALGMSAAEIRGILGEGEVVRYRMIHLVDPWRTESFQLSDGTNVLILYYVTSPPRKFQSTADVDLTPIVLENDRVLGWGWSYLNRNLDRYQVATPTEQK